MTDKTIKASLLQGASAAALLTASVMTACFGLDPVIPATTLAAVATVLFAGSTCHYYDYMAGCKDRYDNYAAELSQSKADTEDWRNRDARREIDIAEKDCMIRTLKAEKRRVSAILATTETRMEETGLWLAEHLYAAGDEVFAAGTADANGVPLATDDGPIISAITRKPWLN